MLEQLLEYGDVDLSPVVAAAPMKDQPLIGFN